MKRTKKKKRVNSEKVFQEGLKVLLNSIEQAATSLGVPILSCKPHKGSRPIPQEPSQER